MEAPIRVLLAEDDPVNALVVAALLQKLGCRVETVSDGRAAVEAASGGFDLLVLDARMPRMDGFAAALALRRRPELSGVPILGLTADGTDEVRDRALAAGMDDVLVKPVALDTLKAALDRWVRG